MGGRRRREERRGRGLELGCWLLLEGAGAARTPPRHAPPKALQRHHPAHALVARWLAGWLALLWLKCSDGAVRYDAVRFARALQLGCCEGGSMQQGVPCPTRPAQPRSQAATCPRLGLAGRHQTSVCRRVWASKAQGSGLACLPAAFDAGALE